MTSPQAVPLAACFGCAGLILSTEERDFFRAANPLGFILFARNVDTPDQVRALVSDLRDCVGRDSAPVLIDQEGGRVQRLKEPHWRSTPAPAMFVALHNQNPESGREATRLNARLIADDLYALGIDVNCLPVLDIPAPGSHPFLHDRAAGLTVEQSIVLGRMDCDGLLAGGVLPVIKHIPGHGRGTVDSHEGMPHVDATRAEMSALDFAPFRALADCPWAMTAHVVYSDIDADQPATLSPTVIHDIIRTEIGFNGFLVSDDVSMGALSGPLGIALGERSDASIKAGCDAVLHCNGELAEMREVTDHVGALSDVAAIRFEKTLSHKRAPEPLDRREAEARLETLLRPVSESASESVSESI